MNLLLIQLKRIGDLILTVPAITAVRRRFPDAGLTVVTSRAASGLLPAISGIDRACAMRGNLLDAQQWFFVGCGGFEACVDFTHNDRSAYLALVSRARRRITAEYVELQSKVRPYYYNELVPSPVRSLHTIDYHLSLLAPLGIRNASREITLDLPMDVVSRADRLLNDAGLAGAFLLVHPGSARSEKFWEPDRWGAVIDRAAALHNLPCVLTGGTSAIERQHISAIKSHAQGGTIDLCGKTDLLALAAIVQRARLFLTVDSAPMHFASAFHTPQVALFGPTNPLHWRPLSRNAIVLQGESGVPVTEFAPKQARVAMNVISTAAVIDAMETLLSAPAACTS